MCPPDQLNETYWTEIVGIKKLCLCDKILEQFLGITQGKSVKTCRKADNQHKKRDTFIGPFGETPNAAGEDAHPTQAICMVPLAYAGHKVSLPPHRVLTVDGPAPIIVP